MRGPTVIMTYSETNDLPLPNLRALIDRHGAFAVGFAYLRAAFARKPRPPDVLAEVLGDHLLRDIGMLPRSPEARLGRRGWDI